MEKVKVSAVSYLNTLPFIYGIEQGSDIMEQIVLSKDHPAECARKLIHNEADLGLVPVAIIPELEEAHIVSNYCIGAVGRVKSVLLVSNVPLKDIETIYLDYQSRTSVRLCQLLVENFWKLNLNYKIADIGFEEQIVGNNAAVIIGDRTFHLKESYAYRYDLAEEWGKWQNLPFVFATWVSNKKLSDDLIYHFNEALKFGLRHIDLAVEHYNIENISKEEQKDYLKHFIHYQLDNEKKRGLQKYIDLITS